MTPRPLKFRFQDGTMVPIVPRAAHELYTEGESYLLAPWEPRSGASHNHYFAVLNEGFVNLPERIATRFPTVEHLRKWLLIRTGFYEQRTIAATSTDEAERIAAFARPLDGFAVVTVEGQTVTVFSAKSQSASAMGRAEFSRSKQSVLEALAEMVGVSVDELANNAGRAA